MDKISKQREARQKKLKKELNELNSKIVKKKVDEDIKDFKIPKNISYVLERIIDLQTSVQVTNPYIDLLKKFGLTKEELKDPKIKLIADVYDYSFLIKNAFDKRKEIIYCMIYVNQIYDAAIKLNLVDYEKERHFKIARGGFKKLLSYIDPYDDEILTRNSRPYDLMKLFSTIETSLSSIATLEDKVGVEPLEIIKNLIYKLAPQDSKILGIKLFDPSFVYDMQQKDRKKIFDLLINDPDKDNNIYPDVVPLDVFELFTNLSNKDKRQQFLDLLKTQLIPAEINFLAKS